jgi:predicted DNA-binding transcriptional regulator YafY
MSRTDRLLRLMQSLRRHRRPVTAIALAEELEVSVRSIYRDVEALRERGAVVQGEAGVGYVLKPGYLLPPLMFSEEEIEALVLGLRLAAVHGDATLARAAFDVVAKLRSVLPTDIGRLLDETTLLAGPTREQLAHAVDLSIMRQTIRRERTATIGYVDAKADRSNRIIWPVALAFFEQTRIVVAWCEARSDFRSFRTDRIETWEEGGRAPRRRAELLQTWREREGYSPPMF